jgi:hypothetical protein
MKTREEMIAEFWEEERKYQELIRIYEGNDEMLGEADHLYQEGVRVDEIAKALGEDRGSEVKDEEQGEN